MVSAEASRRDVLATSAGALGLALAGATPAFADGAVSDATRSRAKGIYGGRIANLGGAVERGDLGAIATEKNAFILFNSGAYSGPGEARKAVGCAQKANFLLVATKAVFL